MSLVRVCVVTVSLFRVCMCMCLRARENERREASARASGTELVPKLEAGDVELRTKSENLQVCGQPLHITSELSLPPVVQANDLESNVGPYSPKRQLAECKEHLQEKFTQRYLRNGLQWLSNSVDENHEEFITSVENQIAGQEGPQVIVEEPEEVDRQLILVEPPTPTYTIAWSEGDSCLIGSPPTTAHHLQEAVDVRCIFKMADAADEKLKTLIDELLETDKTTDADGGCRSEFNSCQCSQLPNQILTTPTFACTINI